MPLKWLGLSFLIGYLVGATSFGYWVIRIFKKKNILEIGDGRPGAANIYREFGAKWGIPIGFLDSFKGALAIILVLKILNFPNYCVITTTLGVMGGHNWSVFLRFRGGDGVGVIMGIYMVLMPVFMFVPITAIYLLFLYLWKKKIKPWYLYHAYNWQSIFCLAPIFVYFLADYMLLDIWGLNRLTMVMLSIAIAAAGLLKPIERFGVLFLFKPQDFQTKYAHKE